MQNLLVIITYTLTKLVMMIGEETSDLFYFLMEVI